MTGGAVFDANGLSQLPFVNRKTALAASTEDVTMSHGRRHFAVITGAMLAGALALSTMNVFAADKERINPPGIFKHPNFTRVITVKGGGKMIFIAGQTPSDIDYKCVAPGDFKGQFISVMESLKKSLEASGATFDDVVHRRTYVLDMDKYLTAMREQDIPATGTGTSSRRARRSRSPGCPTRASSSRSTCWRSWTNLI
jgi:enamine deaminase RidA (YjgF/YER057c/UK114 family)